MNQTPINIEWQGVLFANYKLKPLDFLENYEHYSVSNFSLLRKSKNLIAH